MKNLLFSLAMLLLSAFPGVAQRAYDRSDFERINQTYDRMTVLQTEVQYVYYDNHVITTPSETLNAVFSRNGTVFHYQLGDTETLHTAQMTILADHEEKQILLNNNPPNIRKMLLGTDIDTLLSLCDQIFFSYPSPGIKKYTLQVGLPDMERIDFYFNTDTYLMQRLVLYYSDPMPADEGGTGEKPRMELIYRRQDTHPMFAKDLFSTERFVRKSGNSYVPVSSLRNYAIFDYLAK